MTTIAIIYSVIQLILKAIGLWEEFLNYSDAQRAAEAAERTQKRNDAIDASKKAESDDDIWKSQEDITNNLP